MNSTNFQWCLIFHFLVIKYNILSLTELPTKCLETKYEKIKKSRSEQSCVYLTENKHSVQWDCTFVMLVKSVIAKTNNVLSRLYCWKKINKMLKRGYKTRCTIIVGRLPHIWTLCMRTQCNKLRIKYYLERFIQITMASI